MVIRVSPTIELIAGHTKKKRAVEESRLRGKLVSSKKKEKKRKGVKVTPPYLPCLLRTTMVFRLVEVQGQSK
jgi:hypothetical protein